MEIFLNWIFPIVGIGIIIFSVLAYFLGYGEKLRDKVQEIGGFGVNLKISIISLLIFVGMAFAGSGIYLSVWENISKKEEEIRRLARDKERLALQLEQEQRKLASILVKLNDVTADEVERIQDWECKYSISGVPGLKDGVLQSGQGDADFTVTLSDINATTYVSKIYMVNREKKKKWSFKKPFAPLQFTINLSQE